MHDIPISVCIRLFICFVNHKVMKDGITAIFCVIWIGFHAIYPNIPRKQKVHTFRLVFTRSSIYVILDLLLCHMIILST